jgi:Bacterial membrane protein YfhO
LMWLPLMMLFIDRAVTRQRFTQAAVAGVIFAAQFFCGYLPNQIYYAGAIVLYYLIAAHLQFSKLEGRRRMQALARTLGLMGTTLAVGLTLALAEWLPMLELLRHSNRKIVGAEMSYIYLPPWYALTLIFPNLFGAAYDTRTLNLFTALGVSHDHILYLGIAALAPLGFALFWWKRTRRVATLLRHRVTLFALLAAVSLLVMMTTPLYVPVTRYVPVLQVIRVAVRAGVIFQFAAAALVAVGTDLLIEARGELLAAFARLARRFFYTAAGFVVIATIAALVMKATKFTAETETHGWQAYLRRSAAVLGAQFTRADAGILVPLILLGMIATLFWLARAGRLSRLVLLATLGGLLVGDLFWLSGQFNQSYERSAVYPATEITTLLRGLPPGRVLVVPADLESNRRAASNADKIIAPPNTLLPYQIPTVAGKNQQFPRWYRDYAALIEPQPNLSHVVFNQPRSRFFDLLNVRYVMTYADAPPIAGYRRLAAAEGVAIYENPDAQPRAFFADQAVSVASPADAFAAMRDASFDARREVVIEGGGNETAAAPVTAEPQSSTMATAAIVEDRRNRVVIKTTNAKAGWLVLSDNDYPGWRAAIDGSVATIFRANGTMRAVKVPAGDHMILFEFAPATFYVSLYVSAGCAVVMLIIFVLAGARGRRPRPSEE